MKHLILCLIIFLMGSAAQAETFMAITDSRVEETVQEAQDGRGNVKKVITREVIYIYRTDERKGVELPYKIKGIKDERPPEKKYEKLNGFRSFIIFWGPFLAVWQYL